MSPVPRRSLRAPLAALALVLATGLTWKVGTVTGVVLDESGAPLEHATVRIRASAHSTRTDAHGRFTLTGFAPAQRVRVTAWTDGYYVAGRWVWPWDRQVSLTLLPYSVPDNEDYAWMPPVIEGRGAGDALLIQARLDTAAALGSDDLFFKAAESLTLGCQDCHAAVIYDQWVQAAHALGMSNARFASMYNGTDLRGEHQSPATRYGVDRDYGRFPLRPDPQAAYFGPGYRLDFPDTAGNCAACHLPAAALADPYGVDPNRVQGVDARGSHCDFCHKIAAVRLDDATGLPFDNMPGVLSLQMMRPSAAKQIFFGPYDDVDAGVDTYLPLQRQSEFCAACHTSSFWGVPIYESFAEWKASPYSDSARAAAAGLDAPKTCQDCHMKPDGITDNFAPNRRGQQREPAEIFTHTFRGAADETLLQNAVTLTAEAAREGDALVVRVTLLNDRAGHRVPTDSPLREMILLVEAFDDAGTPLELLQGEIIPAWGGTGDAGPGDYAGLPGRIYEKLLAELWTGVTPTGAYWNATRLLSDNRLAAFASDSTTYSFAWPADGAVTIRVRLLFRRAYLALQLQKGWSVPDIVMEEQTILLSAP